MAEVCCSSCISAHLISFFLFFFLFLSVVQFVTSRLSSLMLNHHSITKLMISLTLTLLQCYFFNTLSVDYIYTRSVDLTLNFYCVCKCDLVNYCFCILVRGRFRVELGVDIKHNQICRKCNLLLAYDFRCILSRVCTAICKFMSPWPHPLPAICSCTKLFFSA